MTNYALLIVMALLIMTNCIDKNLPSIVESGIIWTKIFNQNTFYSTNKGKCNKKIYMQSKSGKSEKDYSDIACLAASPKILKASLHAF